MPRVLIEILAIVEDGSRPDPSIPSDVRRAIAFPAGETTTLRIRLVTRAGVPVVLADDDTLTVNVRDVPAPSSRTEFQVTAVRAVGKAAGFYDAVIASDTTAWLGVSRLLFDVWLRPGSGGASCVLPTSTLILSSASSPPTTPPTPTVP